MLVDEDVEDLRQLEQRGIERARLVAPLVLLPLRQSRHHVQQLIHRRPRTHRPGIGVAAVRIGGITDE